MDSESDIKSQKPERDREREKRRGRKKEIDG